MHLKYTCRVNAIFQANPVTLTFWMSSITPSKGKQSLNKSPMWGNRFDGDSRGNEALFSLQLEFLIYIL